jgi:hypothetical protein
MEEKKLLEERYKYVEARNNVATWFKKNMSSIILVSSSFLFIFKEGLEFSASTDGLLTIIMSMSFTYLFALYMSISMRHMGKKSGKESPLYNSALKYLAEAKNNVKPIIYLLHRFIKYKNETTLQEVKKLYIEENGMSWKLFNSGYYDKLEIKDTLTKEQKDAINNLSTIKITKIQANEILSDHTKSKLKYYDPLYLGKDEKQDSKQATVQMVVTKALLPIITSYFAIEVLLGSSILWGAIQVAIILLMGITHYMEGEDYVLNELRNRQINKADLLIEFKSLYDNHKEIFETEEEIIKSIENEAKKPIEIEIPVIPEEPLIDLIIVKDTL